MYRLGTALILSITSLFVVGCGTSGEEESPTPTSACTSYCADELTVCTGDNAQYADEASCLSACESFATTGTDGDTSGDTLQCRVYHLGAAESDPATHCAHSGESGGGVCVAAARPQ